MFARQKFEAGFLLKTTVRLQHDRTSAWRMD